jgi:hypothetical protein
MPKATHDADPNDRKQGDGTSGSKFHPALRWIRLLLIAGLVMWLSLDFLLNCSPEKAIDALVESEELILALTPKLKGCAKSVQNRQFPDQHCQALFLDTRFYFVEGRFLNDRQDEFHSVIGFHGLAQRSTGSSVDVEARQSVVR